MSRKVINYSSQEVDNMKITVLLHSIWCSLLSLSSPIHQTVSDLCKAEIHLQTNNVVVFRMLAMLQLCNYLLKDFFIRKRQKNAMHLLFTVLWSRMHVEKSSAIIFPIILFLFLWSKISMTTVMAMATIENKISRMK